MAKHPTAQQNDGCPDDATAPDGDYLVRAMGANASVRALAVRSTQVGHALMDAHRSLPTAAAAVARLSTACLLLGGTVKGREQVSIEMRGDGPLGAIYAIADAHGHVRATVKDPTVSLPPRSDGKFDISAGIGSGVLIVTKNLGMKEPYTGHVPLVSGEVARDMVEYFQQSEQKPAAMGLGEILDEHGVQAAGGFLIQAFPGTDDAVLKAIEERIASLPAVSELIQDGVCPEELVRHILPDMEVLERREVSFRCTCSKERYRGILVTLGIDDLLEMSEQDEDTVLTCNFCNKEYAFSREEIGALLAHAQSDVN